jgi:Heme/copper-type cytochrome/quinol oxidases, subunit 1
MYLFYLSLSLLSLLLAGLFGLLIALSRTPAVSLLNSPQLFYHFLVGHVTFSITVWLMSFTLAYWHYKKGRREKVAPPATLLGALLLSLSCLLPYGEPQLNNYIPVVDNPIFYAGLFLFFLGFLVEALKRLNFKEIFSENNLLAVSFAFGILAIITVLPSLLTATDEGGKKMFFERLFWIPGHLQQFLYTSTMLLIWHELLKRNSGVSLSNPILSAGNLFMLFMSFPLFVGFFADPVSDKLAHKTAVVSFGVGLGVPVLIHTFYILKHIKPNLSVSTFALLSSMLIYYVGEIIAYGGMQSDLRIPAHYHGVVSGVSIAFMGFTYYMLKERFGFVVWERLAKLQPLVFSAGIGFLVLGFYLAGRFGVPRKTYGFEYVQDASVLLFLNLMGLGAVMSVFGGMLFLTYAGKTLIMGMRHERAP